MSAGTAAIDSVAWRSTWRRRTVAEKVILFGGIVGCAVVLAPVPAAPLLIVVTLIAARRAGVPFAHVLRTARGPAAFIAIAALSTAVSIDFGALTISMTAHTALGAAELALRAMTASLAMLVFASTTPMTTLTTALRRAGLPAAVLTSSESCIAWCSCWWSRWQRSGRRRSRDWAMRDFDDHSTQWAS